MKKIMLILMCLIFAAETIVCGDVFAQRSVNSAQEAARAAKESLTDRSGGNSSQIEWLDQIIDVVNMNGPASKDAANLKTSSADTKTSKP
ncbi:MAG: hypothetical protein NTY47_06055 [Candidatus Omnitrophica bacterium]|nr:hypothetical protein [Candidatus Omnitrophota bacterium]